MSEQNKALVRRELEMFSTGDFSAIDEILSPDYVGHDPAMPEPLRGPDAFKAQCEGYRTAFPDLQLTVDHQVAEGDYVVTRWTARGTHEGDLMGIAPTGNSVTTTGISIERVVEGLVVEDYTEWDALGLMQAVGAVPAMA
jgi:steroid delta-isomerase-like uncharacterized protein